MKAAIILPSKSRKIDPIAKLSEHLTILDEQLNNLVKSGFSEVYVITELPISVFPEMSSNSIKVNFVQSYDDFDNLDFDTIPADVDLNLNRVLLNIVKHLSNKCDCLAIINGNILFNFDDLRKLCKCTENLVGLVRIEKFNANIDIISNCNKFTICNIDRDYDFDIDGNYRELGIFPVNLFLIKGDSLELFKAKSYDYKSANELLSSFASNGFTVFRTSNPNFDIKSMDDLNKCRKYYSDNY